mgnify:CR=1 FL=1
MDEYQVCSESGETSEIINYEPIQIIQNEIKYNLNIESHEDKLTLSIIDKEQFPSVNYNRTMNFKEIKHLLKRCDYFLNNCYKVGLVYEDH